MIYKDDEEIVMTFISESREHLQEIEHGILKIETDHATKDEEMVNSMFRAAHSIKAGANLLEFKNIEKLSHALENCMQRIRQENMQLESDSISLFLLGIDQIRELLDKFEFSDLADISPLVNQLKNLGELISD